MILADSAFVWRLWVVWCASVRLERSGTRLTSRACRRRDLRALILPLIALTALVGAGLGVIICDALGLVQEKTEGHRMAYQASAIALLVTSMIINWMVTGMIAGRLWWANRNLQQHYGDKQTVGYSQYVKVILALVESGAIYSLFLTGYFIANFVGDVSCLRFFIVPRRLYSSHRATRNTYSRTHWQLSLAWYHAALCW